MSAGITVRQARPDEATALTELAMRAKASWGYDAAFMAACSDLAGEEAQTIREPSFPQ